MNIVIKMSVQKYKTKSNCKSPKKIQSVTYYLDRFRVKLNQATNVISNSMERHSGQKWSRIFWRPGFFFCGREQFFLIEIIFLPSRLFYFTVENFFVVENFFHSREFFIVENFFVVEIFFTVENFFIVENFLQREFFFYCRDIYRQELFTVENIF